MSESSDTEPHMAGDPKETLRADTENANDTAYTPYSESENDVESRRYVTDDLVPHLGVLSPLHLLAWTPGDFKKAQMKVIEMLERKRNELLVGGEAEEEQATRIAAIDAELRGSEEARKVSAELEPSWEDFMEQEQTYEARIEYLENEIERLKTGKASKRPSLADATNAAELERKWLEEASCPGTVEQWKRQVRSIFSDVCKHQEELGAEQRAVSNYRADLDLKKAELQGYRTRVEGDIRSVAATSNELLTMIRNVRSNLQKQKETRDQSSNKAAGGQMTTLDAMLAAEHVFKPTHELAERIAIKVKTAQESIAGFWEGGEKGVSARSPWELIRAIKARDDKIAGLEEEAGELRESIVRFVKRVEIVQDVAARTRTAAGGKDTEQFKDLVGQIGALAELPSGLDPTRKGPVNTESNNTVSKDESSIISDDEYGNVIKMADKFKKMKLELQEQIKRLEQVAVGYKAARDQALKSADESRDMCQLLRDEIELMKAEGPQKIKDAVRECEARHMDKFTECRAEANEVKEEHLRCRAELRKKAAECQDLASKVLEEKKRLLAYKMERFRGQDGTNPVVRKLLEQTDKEQRTLKDRIAELNDAIATLEARNVVLEEALQSEKERLARYQGTVNSVPALKRNLEEARSAAEGHFGELKAAENRIDTLQHELQREKHARFDAENCEAEARYLVATLGSELKDQKEEAEERVAGIKNKLEIEVAREAAKAAESRRDYRELVERHEELTIKFVGDKTAASEPTFSLQLALVQRVSFLERLRTLRDKHAAMLLDNDHAVRQAKDSREELAQMFETEARLRDEQATALLELQTVQASLDRANAELQRLQAKVKEQDEREKDPVKVWDDTPIGMSKDVLESRIETLEVNLAHALRVRGPSGAPADDAEYHGTPQINDPRELFDAVQKIHSTWSISDGPPQCSLTSADVANFWNQGALQSKKLALLRAIRDGDRARGYEAMDGLYKFLRETDLGAASDEAWGSVLYLQAYFHLYVAGDVTAAQAASRQASEHRPEEWSRRFYRDLGAKLEADLQSEKMAGEY